ncbi:TPA: hypothetical protein ACGORV_001040 [Streptococcus suis]
MPQIKVTFADGSTAIFHEEMTFQTFNENDEKHLPANKASLFSHPNCNLFFSFVDILCMGQFFYDTEHPETIYESKNVVKIELI